MKVEKRIKGEQIHSSIFVIAIYGVTNNCFLYWYITQNLPLVSCLEKAGSFRSHWAEIKRKN